MKFYIVHEEMTHLSSLWEVEAETAEEALDKLEKASETNLHVIDVMCNSPNMDFDSKNRLVEEYDCAVPYILSDYIREDESCYTY